MSANCTSLAQLGDEGAAGAGSASSADSAATEATDGGAQLEKTERDPGAGDETGEHAPAADDQVAVEKQPAEGSASGAEGDEPDNAPEADTASNSGLMQGPGTAEGDPLEVPEVLPTSDGAAAPELDAGTDEAMPRDVFFMENFEEVLSLPWRVFDPLEDSQISVEAGQLRVFVPGGVEHDLYHGDRDAVRLMRDAPDGEFRLEVTFLSEPTVDYQLQGLLFEQDASHWLRFNYQKDDKGVMRLSCGYTVDDMTDSVCYHGVARGNPLSLAVERRGDRWAVYHSNGDGDLRLIDEFERMLEVRRIGIFVGNANGTAAAPSFEAVVERVALTELTD